MAQRTVQLGATGIWTSQLDNFPAAQVQEAVAELEQLGFGALWFGEAMGREALTSAGLLLAATKRIVIATGIANIYGRDPVTMPAAQKTLAEAYPNPFPPALAVTPIPPLAHSPVHPYAHPYAPIRPH